MMNSDRPILHIVLVKGWVMKDSKFLIARRGPHELQEPGAWALPGGKVDDPIEKDIIENTLKREIKEEVSVDIGEDIKYLCSSSFIRKDNIHVVSLTFLCNWDHGEAQALDETDEVKWLSIDELKRLEGASDPLHEDIKALLDFLHNK